MHAARPSASFVTMPGRISISCPFLKTPCQVTQPEMSSMTGSSRSLSMQSSATYQKIPCDRARLAHKSVKSIQRMALATVMLCMNATCDR